MINGPDRMSAARPLTCYLSRSPGADQERL